ncbi:MarR family transcriptional regulator [Longispora albida]|uniref:MarR family transcriptional regulator n=1 Tax=Longispora albida TaxID=203523 RepID=UPI0003605E00|nr:MarR family transcriptional regulator [Longispora albida]
MEDLLRELDDQAEDARPVVDVLIDLSIRVRRVGQVLAGISRDAEENLHDLEVLTLLYRLGEPHRASPSQLLRQLSITSGALTGRLDSLESTGCIRRERGVRDRRHVLVELTPAGMDRIIRVQKLIQGPNVAELAAALGGG